MTVVSAVLMMQDYDVALKTLLQSSTSLTMRAVTGAAIAKWLDVELPKVQNLRLDLLGETADGDLVHVELQSGNDSAMPLRMAEYGLGIYRLYRRLPQQIVLYVGQPRARMKCELRGPDMFFRYRMIDIRTLDGEPLLASEDVGDNVIAILAKLRDHKRAVRKILGCIASLEPGRRETALAQLMILAGLRSLAKTVQQEAAKMPIQINLLENEVLGPLIRKKVREGVQQGVREGVRKGELALLSRLIEKRFGPLPASASKRLAGLSPSELEDISDRLLAATSLKELLR